MPKYAGVIVNIAHEAVDRPFSYKIPERLMAEITIGSRVMIPFGKGNSLRKGYVLSLSNTVDFDETKIKEIDSVLLKQESNEDRMVQLAAFIRKRYGSTMIQALKIVLPMKKSYKPVEKKTVLLKIEEEKAFAFYESFLKKSQKAKARLLEALIPEKVLDYSLLRKKLNISVQTFQSLEKQGIIEIQVENYFRNPLVIGNQKKVQIQLNEEQQAIVDSFFGKFEAGERGVSLIHGITGSGKTEVYIEMIKRVVKTGHQAIFLIPEISLTYQTVMRFYRHFGERVSIMNSLLSEGEKYDQFERAKRGEIDVIIGPRSALFTPFRNLGLIVIDEEHEGSYKSESMPRYHAREVAMELGKLANASVVLGSATPSIESYYYATKGDYQLYTLKKRATGANLADVEIVDLREELKSGNRSIFSRRLQELMADRLSKKEQIMLFLNRRGYAGFISCRSCGEVLKCPHCDISLSEHFDGKLRCHYCGYSVKKPELCPNCGSKYILGFRAGTQQVEEQILKIFPKARVLRMDKDTTAKKGSFEKILTDFQEEKADILVGTQMIVKGHDFPNVSLMGVLAADLSLATNDYRAGERSFDLLTQAAGRAGRGDKPGNVVIQTYQPGNYANVYAATQNYEAFYKEEILFRELSDYPPICHILSFMVQSKAEKVAWEFIEKIVGYLDSVPNIDRKKWRVVGPTAAGISKINDYYRFVFFLKSKDETVLSFLKEEIEAYAEINLPATVNLQFDYDPMNPF